MTVSDASELVNQFKSLGLERSLTELIKWTDEAWDGELYLQKLTEALTEALSNYKKRHGSEQVGDDCKQCGALEIDWEEPTPVEDGGFEQTARCRNCAMVWVDVFAPLRRVTVKAGREQ